MRIASNAAVAPFAAAMRLGWYRPEGFAVEVIPLPGSTDCLKFVVTREMDFALPSVDEINRFDSARIAADARARTPGG